MFPATPSATTPRSAATGCRHRRQRCTASTCPVGQARPRRPAASTCASISRRRGFGWSPAPRGHSSRDAPPAATTRPYLDRVNRRFTADQPDALVGGAASCLSLRTVSRSGAAQRGTAGSPGLPGRFNPREEPSSVLDDVLHGRHAQPSGVSRSPTGPRGSLFGRISGRIISAFRSAVTCVSPGQHTVVIDRDAIRAFLADLTDRCARATVSVRYGRLQQFFEWAIAEERSRALPERSDEVCTPVSAHRCDSARSARRHRGGTWPG